MATATATLPPDCHLLSPLNRHAQGRASDYARAAAAAGLSGVVVADRGPSPHRYDPDNRMAVAEFPAYLDWHRELASTPGVHAGLGIELDFYQGNYIHQSVFLKQHPFDLVLGTVRYQSFWARDPAERTLFDKNEISFVWRRYFKLVALLVESGLYDAVSCLDLPKQQGLILKESLLREYALPALDSIAKYGMAVEVNTSGWHDPIHDLYPSAQMLGWARERNIPILFGSSASSPDQVGYRFADAVRIAKEAGYTQYARFEQRRRSLVALP